MNFNVDKAPFDNVHVRRAVAYAIDRKQLTEQVLKNGSVPASGFIAPTCVKTDGGSFRVMESDGYPAEEDGIKPRDVYKRQTQSHTSPFSPPPFMAGAAEVERDKETGHVELLRYMAVVDCGTPLLSLIHI